MQVLQIFDICRHNSFDFPVAAEGRARLRRLKILSTEEWKKCSCSRCISALVKQTSLPFYSMNMWPFLNVIGIFDFFLVCFIMRLEKYKNIPYLLRTSIQINIGTLASKTSR